MAESVNEKLLRHEIGRAIDLQRYSNGEVQKMLALLNRSDTKLTEALTLALIRLGENSFTAQRLNSLLADVYSLNGKTYQGIKKNIGDDLLDLVGAEASFQYDLFKDVIPFEVSVARVAPEAVHAAAMARPFQISKDRAVNLSDYIDGLSASRAASIRDAIRLGFVTGETTDQIVRRIRGTKTQNYADGLMHAPRQHIEGMVRTAISHTSNFARQKFYEENSSLVRGWQFVATLDNRTSVSCASLSGKVFPIGKGPVPPIHANCRSVSIPVTRSFRDLGIDTEEFKSTRSSMDGQIAEDISFTEWLRSKPAAFQDDVLGATRGRLFRSNEIDVDKFTNDKGRVYTLEQLRSRSKELFEKAGI